MVSFPFMTQAQPFRPIPAILYVIVGGLAFLVRLVFITWAPSAMGDGNVYSVVAENILTHGCVSVSDPTSGACVPHWGGHHFPGYPFFVAMAWWAFGKGLTAPLLLQAVFGTAAILYLVRCLDLWLGSRRPALAAGLVLALSPVEAPFARLLWTETLAVAASTWILAELARSIRDKRLRVLPIALAWTVAIYLRLDLALLAAPIGLVAWRLHGFAGGVAASVKITVFVTLAVGAWTVRNVQVGLSPLPTGRFDEAHGAPSGFLRWTSTWVTNQADLEVVNWRAATLNYRAIDVPASATDTPEERRRLDGLIDELRQHTGALFPPSLDAAFARLAEERIAADPLRHRVVLPIKRTLWLWFDPTTSFGWPISVERESRARIVTAVRGFDGATALSEGVRSAEAIMVKGGLLAYRIGLSILLVLACFRRRDEIGALTEAALAAFVARLLVFAWILEAVEPRYLVQGWFFVEAAAAAYLARPIRHRA
ncbi:MAG: hypothetical protein FJX47_19815 [Alphaproteobacteria bacterium]|nr:hypothetical protein [Alphaproteobacteria bacterium]